jgi:triosephosphate isomerase
MDSGAYTGEISASMLSDLKVRYCIVGHSERRDKHGETDQVINQKVKALINNDITPILCVGETLSHRESGQSNKIITNQLSDCLCSIEKNKIIIAYEPIWAIGAGKSASVEDISSMNANIKNYMNGLGYVDEQFYILYGGSVSIDNLLSIKDASFLDGFLIGGASLCASAFWKIIDK